MISTPPFSEPTMTVLLARKVTSRECALGFDFILNVVFWSFMSNHIIPLLKLADAKTLDVGDSAAGPLRWKISLRATGSRNRISPYALVVN